MSYKSLLSLLFLFFFLSGCSSGQVVGEVDVNIIDNNTGRPVNNQHPFSTNGDSVYAKDIWVEQSNMYNFDGKVTDLFDNLHSLIIDSTTTPIKTMLIHFDRTIPTTVIGIGSFQGNFSNLKIIGLTSGNIEFTLYDGSGDNNKIPSATIFVPTVGFNAIKLEFHTTDTITLSNLFIIKAQTTVSRIQGEKPDGDFTEFQATQAGNLKVSLEEYENTFNENALPIKIKSEDGNFTAIIDERSSSLVTIDFGHHEIHEGEHFFKKSYVEIPSLSQVDFLFITPSTNKKIHLIINTEGTSEYIIEGYENVTVSNNGTSVVYFNRERNFPDINGVNLFSNPTITNLGTMFFDAKKGAGKQTGGESRSNNEIVLRQNTSYVVRMINNAAGTVNTIDYVVDWYAH